MSSRGLAWAAPTSSGAAPARGSCLPGQTPDGCGRQFWLLERGGKCVEGGVAVPDVAIVERAAGHWLLPLAREGGPAVNKIK